MAGFLLLRPQPKCDETAAVFQRAGLSVFCAPLQQIVPLPDEIAQCQQALEALQQPCYVVITSTYAAHMLLSSDAPTNWPHARFIAVGPATAKVLEQANIKVRLPRCHDSEGLLEMAELADVQDKPVIIITGHGGRTLLADTLRERQAIIHQFELYRRVLVTPPAPQQIWQNPAIECIIATSGEQIEQAFAVFEHSWLRSRYWITVSLRLVDILKARQVEHITLSEGAEHQQLLNSAKQVVEQQPMANKPVDDNNSQSLADDKPQHDSPTEAVSDKVQRNAPEQPAGARRSTGGRRWIALLVLLNILVIAGFSTAGYWAWTHWSDFRQQQQQQLSETEQQLRQQTAQRMQQMQQDLDNAKQQLSQTLSQQVQQLGKAVDSNHNLLAELQQDKQPSDWVLAEADYLLRVAGRKLWLEHDVATSSRMLHAADQRLADLHDPSLLPVREKIHDDIQQLQNINNVSLTDIAMELAAMARQVDQLPLVQIELPSATEPTRTTKTTDSVADWRANLVAAWHRLVDDFISVKRRTDQVKPLLSANQQWLLSEQLRQYLLQAETFVLRGQGQLAKQTLALAEQTLKQHFDTQAPNVSQFITQLTALNKTDLQRHYPQVLSSQQALQQILKQRLPALENSQSALPGQDATLPQESL